MASTPTVSVVMVVRNGAAKLPRTLAALYAQTLPDFELIALDNGSSDDTWEVLQDIERARVRLHRNLKPRPATAALIQALAWASGRYLVCHGVGDVSAPQRLERQAALLHRRKEVAAVWSALEWADEAGQVLRRVAYPTQHHLLVQRIEEEECPALGAVMVRREALEAVGGLREAFALAAELDLWLRLADVGKLASVGEVLYTAHFHADLPAVAQHAAYQDYAALVRLLAEERRRHGTEQTAVAAAADAISARYAAMNPLARRLVSAEGYLAWARRVRTWDEVAHEQARRLWLRALAAWPFRADVWQYAREQRQG